MPWKTGPARNYTISLWSRADQIVGDQYCSQQPLGLTYRQPAHSVRGGVSSSSSHCWGVSEKNAISLPDTKPEIIRAHKATTKGRHRSRPKLAGKLSCQGRQYCRSERVSWLVKDLYPRLIKLVCFKALHRGDGLLPQSAANTRKGRNFPASPPNPPLKPIKPINPHHNNNHERIKKPINRT